MEVILQEDVTHLGHVGEVVKVRDGYARNYLFPRGLAVLANTRNVGELDHQRRVVEEKRLRIAASAQELAKKMGQVELTFTARAGDGGKLFGSITNQDIERELRDKGFDVDRRRVRLDEPIKSVGSHKVTVTLAAGVPCEITVRVSALEAADGTTQATGGTAAAEPPDEAATDEPDA
jgi:large subunit ribosomal protein L9